MTRQIPEGVKEVSVTKVKVGMELAPDYGKVTGISKVTRTTVDVVNGKKQPAHTRELIVFKFASGPDRWHPIDGKVFHQFKRVARKKVAAQPKAKPTGPSYGVGEFSKARGDR